MWGLCARLLAQVWKCRRSSNPWLTPPAMGGGVSGNCGDFVKMADAPSIPPDTEKF